jgi:phage gp36-like protein
MAYATGSNLASRYDARLLGDLCQDAGDRISDLATLVANPNVLQALEDASGMINSAALVGHRYAVGDLAGMTGEGAAFLQRITCDLAFAFLRQRRGYDVDQYPTVKESFRFLDRLRLGERVFDIEANEAAGNPTTYQIPSYVILQQPLVTNNNRYWPNKRFLGGSW